MEQYPTSQPSQKKKWLKPAIIIGSVVAIVIVIIILVTALTKPKEQPQQETQTRNAPTEFQMTLGDAPVTYAGNPVYDACGLIPFDVIRKNVKNYQQLLDMNGTDKKPSDPLTIEHNYIDRTIEQPLGKDAEPRQAGTTIGQDGVSASSFVSSSDVSCWYGQGDDLSLGIGKTFAKVFVTQKPTPVSAEFTAYLARLNKAGSEGDLDAYVEPAVDSSGFFTGIVVNRVNGVVVIFKASTRELAQIGTTEISSALASAPKGPLKMTYPKAWSSMPNPCELLSAEDFERITTKPTGAIAEDKMILNEVGGRLMQRSCERLEIERLDGTPIAKSTTVVRLADSEESAKKYVDELKKNETDQFEIQPLKQRIKVADDAYIKKVKSGDKVVGYEFDVRVGAAIIVFGIEPENGVDASADAYAAKLLPVAQRAAEKMRQ